MGRCGGVEVSADLFSGLLGCSRCSELTKIASETPQAGTDYVIESTGLIGSSHSITEPWNLGACVGCVMWLERAIETWCWL